MVLRVILTCCRILIPFEDYEKKPNAGILRRYDDDYVNILFTGPRGARTKSRK